MQNTLTVAEKKDFRRDSFPIVRLPEILIDYILDFSDARENAVMASSCLAMWSLLNKNRHWFMLTGMHESSEDVKKQILASQNITVNMETGIPEYAGKEYFLRVTHPNHILKGYTECGGDEKSFENTKLRNFLINSYKHIIILPNVAYEFYMALRSSKISYFIIPILSCYPYFWPLMNSVLNKLLSLDGNADYQKLPKIGLLKSAPTEEDILQIQKRTLLIFR